MLSLSMVDVTEVLASAEQEGRNLPKARLRLLFTCLLSR
jgi:hypothetical protein